MAALPVVMECRSDLSADTAVNRYRHPTPFCSVRVDTEKSFQMNARKYMYDTCTGEYRVLHVLAVLHFTGFMNLNVYGLLFVVLIG